MGDPRQRRPAGREREIRLPPRAGLERVGRLPGPAGCRSVGNAITSVASTRRLRLVRSGQHASVTRIGVKRQRRRPPPRPALRLARASRSRRPLPRIAREARTTRRPELARSQQTVAGGEAAAEPPADAHELVAGLAARDRFIAIGATEPRRLLQASRGSVPTGLSISFRRSDIGETIVIHLVRRQQQQRSGVPATSHRGRFRWGEFECAEGRGAGDAAGARSIRL